MNRSILLGLASVVLASTANPAMAFRSDPAEGTTTASTSEQPKTVSKKRYCIVETPLGSHIPKKTCLTREQWLDRGVDLPEQ